MNLRSLKVRGNPRGRRRQASTSTAHIRESGTWWRSLRALPHPRDLSLDLRPQGATLFGSATRRCSQSPTGANGRPPRTAPSSAATEDGPSGGHATLTAPGRRNWPRRTRPLSEQKIHNTRRSYLRRGPDAETPNFYRRHWGSEAEDSARRPLLDIAHPFREPAALPGDGDLYPTASSGNARKEPRRASDRNPGERLFRVNDGAPARRGSERRRSSSWPDNRQRNTQGGGNHAGHP